MPRPLPRFQKWVNREVRPLMLGRTMRSAVPKMNEEELFETWAILNYLSRAIDARKQQLREKILEQCKRSGNPYTDKKGNFAGRFETRHENEVRAQRRMSALPDEKSMKLLLEKKAIDFDKAFSKVQRVVLDPSKIHDLVECGKLTKEEVDKTHDTSWALSVKVSPELHKHLEGLDGEA